MLCYYLNNVELKQESNAISRLSDKEHLVFFHQHLADEMTSYLSTVADQTQVSRLQDGDRNRYAVVRIEGIVCSPVLLLQVLFIFPLHPQEELHMQTPTFPFSL